MVEAIGWDVATGLPASKPASQPAGPVWYGGGSYRSGFSRPYPVTICERVPQQDFSMTNSDFLLLRHDQSIIYY